MKIPTPWDYCVEQVHTCKIYETVPTVFYRFDTYRYN